jgi:hypothetical protein
VRATNLPESVRVSWVSNLGRAACAAIGLSEVHKGLELELLNGPVMTATLGGEAVMFRGKLVGLAS